MRRYKIYFHSEITETLEVDAESKLDAQRKIDMGEVDFSDAIQTMKENMEVDQIHEV